MTKFLSQLGLCVSLGLIGCGGARYGNDFSRADLSFTIQNTPRRLSEYRGKPVVLILMRTSEMVSQIYMERLSAAYSNIRPFCNVIVLTVEPTEAPFVDTYRDIQKLPVDVGVADSNVSVGRSKLGVIPFIPYTYFVDDRGVIVHTAPGVIETDDLQDLVGRIFDR